MLSDTEIAARTPRAPITEIAAKLGINSSDLIPYGHEIAKIHIDALQRSIAGKEPGKLILFSEPNNAQLLQNGDNLALMPNGDLLVCEDHQGMQRLIGVTQQGEYYVLARNARGASEFAGATFAPDGSTLFVNLQQQGGTVAITGPWHKRVNT